MSIVKSLANMGLTVVATIHSPTPYAFSLFDRMLLLLGGKLAYFGPTGACCAVHSVLRWAGLGWQGVLFFLVLCRSALVWAR